MRIGIDFDNTIVCYDQIFYQEATRCGLIPKTLSPKKNAVRQYVRENAGEDQWVFLQSIVYGHRINDAKPYPGVVKFFSQTTKKLDVYIISHKTHTAMHDAKTDLIKAARSWLEKYNIPNMLPHQAIHFENSRENKISRIKKVGCDVFIDDLIETFLHPNFPKNTRKILFNPDTYHAKFDDISIVHNWNEIKICEE